MFDAVKITFTWHRSQTKIWLSVGVWQAKIGSKQKAIALWYPETICNTGDSGQFSFLMIFCYFWLLFF